MYGDPGYEGPEIGVTDYGFARNFTPELLRRLQAVYAAEVTMTDRWFGHFMDRFHELGLHENTVVVLMSDHGYLLGERGYTGKVPSQLHPELAQVPLRHRAPGRTRGRRESATTSHRPTTSGPTVLSMVGIDRPDWIERNRPLPRPRRRPPGARSATSTTAACTTASSSAPTTGC